MSDSTTIFQNVLSRLAESLTPHINQNLILLEKESAQEPQKNEFGEIFNSFPRNLSQYSSVISTLTKVGKYGSTEIVVFLVDTIKTIFKTKKCSIFLNIHRSSTAFKKNNKLHSRFMMHFELIFLVDLILQIISNYGTESLDSVILDCCYYFVEASDMDSKSYNKILKQWAMIISFVSETAFASFFLFFKRHVESQYVENVFMIMQYLRLDLNDNFSKDFLEFLLNALKNLQKKKVLNNKILKCVSNMVTSELSHEEKLQSLFDYAYILKKDKSLKNGSFDLISSLFPRIKKNPTQYTEFYKKRVYNHAGDDQKVKRSLKMFQKLMFGTDIDIKWYYWSWGEMINTSPLCYIHWNSNRNKHMKESDSFAGLFMHYFFQKSNFAICPNLFRDVILHLASLDFSYFLSNILPPHI